MWFWQMYLDFVCGLHNHMSAVQMSKAEFYFVQQTIWNVILKKRKKGK